MRRRISLFAVVLVVLGGLPHGLRADDLRVALPDDVKFVVRVDLPAIQKSTVGGRLLARAKEEILGKMADKGSEGDGKGKDLSLDKIVEMLGFDPFEEVQSVVVAAADYESPEQSLVGCIQLGKTTGNLEGLLLALPHYSVEEHGEHEIHAATPEEGKQVFGAFFTAADGNRTVLIAAKREAVVQLLDSLDGNGPSEGLKAVTLRGEGSPLAALDVFELPDEMTAEEGPPANIAKILRSLSVRVDEADGQVNIQTTLVAGADKQAEQLEQAARGLSAMVDLALAGDSEDEDLQQVQRFLRDVIIERSGSSLQLSLSVPADEVQKLIDDNLLDKQMLALENSLPTDLRAIEANELARRAHGGCADAFTELSRRYRPRLLHLVEPRLGGRLVDAEDVAQEALARAFQRLDQFDPRYQFSTWLYTIAIRLAHDHARSRRRRPRQVALDIASALSTEPSAPLATERQDDVDNVWQLAKRVLSDAQFTAMWLHYGEDLPPIEVAQVMRRSRIGVRVLLHRARTRLVTELVPQGPASCASRLPGREAD